MLWLSLLFACPAPTDKEPPPDGDADADADADSDTDSDTDSDADSDTTGSTSETGSTDPCGDPTLELGNGVDAHEPLADMAPLTIVHGAQGGWHLDYSGQVTSFNPVVQVTATATLTDGTQIAGGKQPSPLLELLQLDKCTGVFFGETIFVDDQPLPKGFYDYQEFICSLAGQQVDVHLSVLDLTNSEEIEQTVRAVLASDPEDAMYNCP